jgi:PD-(D/E)XK nuclease superfamily
MLWISAQDQTYQIIGVALEVHKELGCGFLEPVYLNLAIVESHFAHWSKEFGA